MAAATKTDAGGRGESLLSEEQQRSEGACSAQRARRLQLNFVGGCAHAALPRSSRSHPASYCPSLILYRFPRLTPAANCGLSGGEFLEECFLFFD